MKTACTFHEMRKIDMTTPMAQTNQSDPDIAITGLETMMEFLGLVR